MHLLQKVNLQVWYIALSLSLSLSLSKMYNSRKTFLSSKKESIFQESYTLRFLKQSNIDGAYMYQYMYEVTVYIWPFLCYLLWRPPWQTLPPRPFRLRHQCLWYSSATSPPLQWCLRNQAIQYMYQVYSTIGHFQIQFFW